MDTTKVFTGIGGKNLGLRFDNWVIDLTFLPIFIVVFLVPSVFIEVDSTKSFTLFSYWVIEKIFAWGSCLLIWWLGTHFISKKSERSVSFLSIWVLGFLCGFIGCAVGEIFGNWLGLTFKIDFYPRAIYTSLTCISVVLLTSMLGRGRRSFLFYQSEIRRALIKQRIYKIRKSKSYLTRFDLFQNQIASKVIALSDGKSTKSDISRLRLALRDLSHELSGNASDKRLPKPNKSRYFNPDFSRKLFLISIRSEPLNSNFFTLVFGVFICVPILQIEPSFQSLIPCLWVLFVTLIIHNAQHHYWKVKAPVKTMALLSFDFINVFMVLIGLAALRSYFGFYEGVTAAPFLIAMIAVIYAFFYILGHITRVGDIAELNAKEFRQEEIANIPSQEMLIEDEEKGLQLAWAKFIHSDLQSHLLARELSKSPSASKSVAPEVKKRVVGFKKSIVYFGDQKILSLADCFKYLDNKWSGILSIKVNTERISKSTKINPQAIADLKDLLNELALNAVKHGGAELLSIEVKSDGNHSLVVLAENDGAPLGTIKPGLGTGIFDLLCGKNWSLKNYRGMVVFTGRIYNS